MNTLPNKTSNKKFGYFFFFLFMLLAIYFFLKDKDKLLYIFVILSAIFFTVTYYKDLWLKELNNVWFNLGIFLSKLVSPLILAIIFYFIITPFGIIKKIFKLGTANNKNKIADSFWRDCIKEKNNFNNPF